MGGCGGFTTRTADPMRWVQGERLLGRLWGARGGGWAMEGKRLARRRVDERESWGGRKMGNGRGD
eukprot:5889568-Pleurochrysis_carterae.AAC.1